MNHTEVRGPYGGANAFLRTLRAALERRGVVVTNDLADPFDLAFLNALTDDIDLAFVERLAERGVPIVHRKVGYRVSGSPEMRRVVDGVAWGDRLQLEFSPYLAHTVFQSDYSREVFVAGGFAGPYTVIPNGVDEEIFNTVARGRLLRRASRRRFWDGAERLRVVISTWSTDENKGFADYQQIDELLDTLSGVGLTLVGRTPPDVRFRRIRVLPPRGPQRLAAELKRHHVLLQLARYETCSNALIEGLNCGLPAIYLESGANTEVARDYGVPYRGDFPAAVDAVKERYADIVSRIEHNPYRGSLVVERYLSVFEQVLGR